MPLADTREIWADVAGEMVPVRVGGWRAAVLRDDLPHLEEAVCADSPVRLLPYFDSFILGHKDREHLVAEKDRKSIYRAQGWIAPVVLVDGRAAGVWALARAGDRLTVHVTKFAALSRRVTTGILAEAHDLGRFLGVPSVAVHLG